MQKAIRELLSNIHYYVFYNFHMDVGAVAIPSFQNSQLLTMVCFADGVRIALHFHSYARLQSWAETTPVQTSYIKET
jgi:hypothetical protein